MSGRREPPADEKQKVPGYIVTFSDMVTLLLTFFVLLLSLADTQDQELIDKGRDSFNQAIRSYGLGMLVGQKNVEDLGEVKIMYNVKPTGDEADNQRTISATEDRTEGAFLDLIRNMNALPSQIEATDVDFMVANVKFEKGQYLLDESSKKFLRGYCSGFRDSHTLNSTKFYILGIASDTPERQSWYVSAKRAKVVADYMRSNMPSGYNWPIYNWGAGQGGDWVGEGSPISKKTSILITVLKK